MNPSILAGSHLNQKETLKDHSEYDIQGHKRQDASVFIDKRIDDLLTVDELALLLKCSKGTIRNWVYQGKIPVVRPAPRMVRFNIHVIQRWL
ncbi:helix-turn-helix domain-containing protein, partial [bacterium]|nr:helix-turn-helix domain-containing protein [bacterium]